MQLRRLAALVCVVALLAAAMAPATSAWCCAILVPLAPLVGGIVSIPLELTDPAPPLSPAAAAPLPSRAPPVA